MDYKLYYWDDCDISRTANITNAGPIPIPSPIKTGTPKKIETVELKIKCPRCGKEHVIPAYTEIKSEDIKRLNLSVNKLLKDNAILSCDTPGCGLAIDLKPFINHVEGQIKKKLTIQ